MQANVPYGPEPLEKLDVCARQTDRPSPALLLVHGGNWQHGDKTSLRGLCRLAALKGMIGVSVDYALATDAADHWPKQATDVELALTFVRGHARELGVDPARICMFGTSSGAQIALFVGTEPSRPTDGTSQLSCLILNATPADLTDPAVRTPSQALFGTAERDERKEHDASPLFRVGRSTAATLLIHGRNDPLVPFRQAEALESRLRENGVPVQTIYHEGEHGTGELPLTERRDINEAVVDFASRRFANMDRNSSDPARRAN